VICDKPITYGEDYALEYIMPDELTGPGLLYYDSSTSAVAEPPTVFLLKSENAPE